MRIFSTYNLWENIPPLFNKINEMLYHVHTQLSLHKKIIHQLNWIFFMSSAFFVLRFVFCLLHLADNIFCNYSKSGKLVWSVNLNNYLKRPKLFNCQSVINFFGAFHKWHISISFWCISQMMNMKHVWFPCW